MTQINWGMLQGPSVPDALQAGLQTGQRNALLHRDIQMQDEAMNMRRAEAQRQAGRDARQERMELSQDQQRFVVTGARVIEQVRPQDQAGWDRARSTMQQLGFDVSEVPPQFDPNYASQVVEAARAITDHSVQPQSNAAKQAVDMGYRPGTPEFQTVVRQIIEAGMTQPYTGSGGETRVYTPRIGGPAQSGPQPGAIEDGYRFKGGNPADPSSWEPVMTDQQGGQALSAAAGSQVISPQEAERVRQSLGPNGQAAFQDWLRRNNITIGGR